MIVKQSLKNMVNVIFTDKQTLTEAIIRLETICTTNERLDEYKLQQSERFNTITAIFHILLAT